MSLTNLTRETNVCSHVVSTQTLTIAANGKVQGGDVECREVHVIAESGKTVYIGGDSSVSNTCPLLPNTYYLKFNLDNTESLWFYGTAGDKVFLITGD